MASIVLDDRPFVSTPPSVTSAVRYPSDNGFGIKSWYEVSSETCAAFFDQDVAMWMGSVTLISKDGHSITVDKSWGYKKVKNGALKIILHHSSLPYNLDLDSSA